MHLLKKITSAAAAAAVAVGSAAAVPPKTVSEAATTIVISPDDRYEINGGKFEGWGTSLCWWANRVGYSDSLAQQTADLFFGDEGLRMNIARFNIGGGDDPSHDHITRTDSNMPGYTKYSNGSITYDWTADYNQRNVLQRAIKAAGDDMIVEMFSNSPPYYMTKSGCSSGGTDPAVNNLKDDQYDEFAAYLAEVCYHYKNDWGIDIQSIDAMNEPYTNYWGAYSKKQEGCHFDQGTTQTNVILELQKAMKAKGMGDVIISGTDETSIDTQISSFEKLSDAAKSAVGRIDTHTYSGSKRSQLKELALSAGKNLWMSEVDGGGTGGTNAGEMGAGLWLAERITTDCSGLNCSAWILWQAIDNHISSAGYNGKKDSGMVNTSGGYWGLAVADHDNNKVILTKKYYTYGQYSRYIRPGMTMLKTSGPTLAAFDEEKGKLVIVAYNSTGSAADYSYDLTGFTQTGSYAQMIRTSNTENWKDAGTAAVSGGRLSVSLPANSVTTFIIDGMKGSRALENKIDITGSMTTGTDSWKSAGSTNYEKAFDGNMSTYFDGVSAGWVQADLGKVYDISAIGYCPRNGYEYRMTDGSFSFSEDGVNWHTAYTITDKPAFGMHYATRFAGGSTARYIKYSVPEGAPANNYNTDSSYCCNIAEIEVYGTPSVKDNYTRIVPVEISGSSSWKDTVSVNYEKAFDGDQSTYFDGLSAGWIQADLGAIYDVQAIGYCPRKGYEYRMPDGRIQVSVDGENWTDIYTITAKPEYGMTYVKDFTGALEARYVRYIVPEGKPSNGYNADDVYCCNIAEFEIYGEKTADIVVKGDINCDGSVNIGDLVLMQKYLLADEKLTAEQYSMADMDGDGRADGFDMVLLRRALTA